MSWTIPLALYGWVPLVALLFVAFAPARAVLIAYLVGWMFLPVPGIELAGFDYNKSTAVPLIVFLGVLVFDGARLSRLRASLVDLPMIVFCLVPLATSLSNGLGWYDGLTALVYQTITWGLPYLMGRLYFASPEGLRQLALGLLAGGLVYAPLCLWEIRMSPQLHAWVYGEHQHEWVQVLRSGGYRPMVFMQHGLMVGLWMCAASLVGLTLWSSGVVRRIWGIPLGPVVLLLVVTTVLGKSFGAIVLLAVGASVLLALRLARSSWPVALLVCLPLAYVGVRVTGAWTGQGLVDVVREVSSERASSLAFRLQAEERLRERAAEKPLLGWGGWGRSFARRPGESMVREQVTIDSLWIIVLGKQGALGLASLLLALLVPVLVLWRRCPPWRWTGPAAAGAWALALVLLLFVADSLVNAMINPVYVLIAGGLCGLAPALARSSVRARAAPLAPLTTGHALGVRAP